MAEGREGGGGGLTRLNHGEVCTGDCGVTRQRGRAHVSGRKVESHSEATGQDSQKVPQTGGRKQRGEMIWICSASFSDGTQHGTVLGSPTLTEQHDPEARVRDHVVAQQLGSVKNTSNYHEVTSAPGKHTSYYLRGQKQQTDTANVTLDGKNFKTAFK